MLFKFIRAEKNRRGINLILFDKLSFFTVKSCTSSEKMNIIEQFWKNYSTPLHGSISRLNSKFHLKIHYVALLIIHAKTPFHNSISWLYFIFPLHLPLIELTQWFSSLTPFQKLHFTVPLTDFISWLQCKTWIHVLQIVTFECLFYVYM